MSLNWNPPDREAGTKLITGMGIAAIFSAVIWLALACLWLKFKGRW